MTHAPSPTSFTRKRRHEAPADGSFALLRRFVIGGISRRIASAPAA